MDKAIEIYTSQDGSIQLNVKLENDTVWLNRQQMAELFGRDYKTISKHINNALHEELAGCDGKGGGELDKQGESVKEQKKHAHGITAIYIQQLHAYGQVWQHT